MRGSLQRWGMALALASSIAPKAVAAATAPEDLPPPREIFDCSSYPAPTRAQLITVATAFNKAWSCATGVPDGPFPLLDLNGYGCYCGGGSTGLDTAPVDGYDACCRQHDIDWTALCRNVADPTRPGKGCDCYVNVPVPTGCQNFVPTFANNLNACQQACSRELTKQFACYAKYFDDSQGDAPDWTRFGNWCEWQHYPNPLDPPLPPIKVGPKRPFDEILPSYCKKSTDSLPDSVFGNYDPGSNVFKQGCTCELAKADCSGSVSGCARSADACLDMGGVPGDDCYGREGTCTANVDVTAKPCAYRDPNDLCACPPPALPANPPVCNVTARAGDPCNPCTGRPARRGGKCEFNLDVLVCVPQMEPPVPPSPPPSMPPPSPPPMPTPSAPPPPTR